MNTKTSHEDIPAGLIIRTFGRIRNHPAGVI